MPELASSLQQASPTLDGLPTECLQQIAGYLRESPKTLPQDPSLSEYHTMVIRPQSLESTRNFALVNRRLYTCISPLLYTFPVLHTIRQATLLYRTLICNEDRSGLIKGIRLDISAWSPEQVRRADRGIDSRLSRMSWRRNIRMEPEATIWPEDAAANLVADLLQCLPTNLEALVLEQSWLYYSLRVGQLFRAITSLKPKEVHFFGVEPALTERDGQHWGSAFIHYFPWLLENTRLTHLDISDLAMHESLGLVLVDVAPKQLSTLRFKIREGCPTVPYSSLVEPLGKLFKPEHVDFTFLGVGIYVISHQLVTGTFQGLQSLALHAGVIPDDQNSVAINPGRREVLWEDFPANKSAPFPATLSVHTSRLGDPAHALWNLPSAVQNLCLHLKNANPSTLLMFVLSLLRQGRLPKTLKHIKLDASGCVFNSGRLERSRVCECGTQVMVHDYLDMWHILEPAAKRLAATKGIELETLFR